MRNTLRKLTESGKGMTHVYFAPRRTGKTTAGLALLEFALEVSDGKVPCKFIDAGSSLRHSMRKALGVPDGVDDSDFVSYLCFEVLKVNRGLPSSPDVYSNALCQSPPVFVIDNLRSFSWDDMDFLEILYKACYEGRILLFILTDDEEIANMVCAMNGKARIQPLDDMFEFKEGINDWEIVQDGNSVTGKIAQGLQWKVQHWNRKKLSKIVKECYKDYDWSEFEEEDGSGLLTFCLDGQLPDTVLDQAAIVMAKSAVPEVRSIFNKMDDPKYNDNLLDDKGT